MDYAFAPGEESELKKLQQLLRDRTDGAALDTELIGGAGVTTVTDFLRRVDTVGTLPVGDLVLGSHGNDTGWMEIDLDAAADRKVSYRVLKEAYDDVARRNRLRVPPSLYTTAQGQRAPTRVLIKGCRIGQAPKFVDGLKMLFGGKIPVVAPRHFVFVGPILKTRRKKVVGFLGSIEYLCYSNEITSPTALKRAEIVAALRAKNFPQYDHTSSAPSLIPDLWDTWVPEKAKDLTEGKHPVKYKVSLGRTIEKLSEHSARAQFRYFPLTIKEPITNPPANVKTKAGFKLELSKQPKHQPGWGPTGFPVYEQLGHTTFDQFFDSFTWTSPKDPNANPFTWVGTRHEYNVLLPVVVPPMTGKKTDRLIYNFFPPRGTGGTTFVELDETEPGLFYTSPGAP